MARAIGAGLGGLVGLVGPRLASALAGLLPTAIASGTAQGAAMGGAAATSTIATQTAGVAGGQAAVAAGAVGPATAAGSTIGRAMALGIQGALLLAIPLIIAGAIAIIGDQFLEGVKKEIDENIADAVAAGDDAALAALEKDLQDRIGSARRSHVNEPGLRALEAQLARVQAARRGEMFGPPRPMGDFNRMDPSGAKPSEANEWTSGWSRGVDKLHEDLVKAIDAIKETDDPAALAAALGTVLASILGGEGNAAQTTAVIAELEAKRDAALARGDTATAQAFANAIAKVEPFAKGRQWQKEQIDEARKIVASNKTTADKVAALKGIQQDLLSHNRTMAADLVAKLIDIERGVDKLPTALKSVVNRLRQGAGGGTPLADEGPSGPAPTPKPPATIGGLPPGIRAFGGAANARSPYWVGEREPELFVPRTSGSIVPASDLPGMAGGNTTINVPIQGLIPYRDAMTIPNQLKRLRDFGVLTPRRSGT
jgi:hypothetical protein